MDQLCAHVILLPEEPTHASPICTASAGAHSHYVHINKLQLFFFVSINVCVCPPPSPHTTGSAPSTPEVSALRFCVLNLEKSPDILKFRQAEANAKDADLPRPRIGFGRGHVTGRRVHELAQA